jgi:chemotaxis protein histidine kinase CheA
MSIIKNYVPAKGICKVTFSYPTTEGVQSVQVLGDFNNWDSKVAPKMKKNKTEFSTAIELAAGKTYEFKYLLNNEQWENDINADQYLSSPYAGITNSVLVIDAVAAPAIAKASKAAAPKTAPVKKETVKAVKTPAAKATEAKVAPAKSSTPKATTPKAVVTKAAAPKSAAPAKVTKAAAPKAAAKAKPVAAPKATVAKVVKVDLKK